MSRDKHDARDHALGMHSAITRRDFLQGIAVSASGALAGTSLIARGSKVSGAALASAKPL